VHPVVTGTRPSSADPSPSLVADSLVAFEVWPGLRTTLPVYTACNVHVSESRSRFLLKDMPCLGAFAGRWCLLRYSQSLQGKSRECRAYRQVISRFPWSPPVSAHRQAMSPGQARSAVSGGHILILLVCDLIPLKHMGPRKSTTAQGVGDCLLSI
jgi:hypothetical protein